MTISGYEISRCGLCKFYRYEGRRDGRCSQLNASVSSDWKACCLGASPFRSISDSVAGIAEGSLTKKVEIATVHPSETTVAITYSQGQMSTR